MLEVFPVVTFSMRRHLFIMHEGRLWPAVKIKPLLYLGFPPRRSSERDVTEKPQLDMLFFFIFSAERSSV